MVCQRMWLQPHFPRDERREVQACRIDNETINFLPNPRYAYRKVSCRGINYKNNGMTYHQLKYLLWSVVVGVTLSLTSCMKWDYGDAVEDFNATGAGLFITNEGNFQYGNATLSYYDPATKQVQNEIFFRANGMKLGDVAQSMTIYDNKGWVVVNNSHVIFAIDLNTFKEVGRIENLTSPRYIHFLSDEKAYVTQLWDNRIFIINPKKYEITGYIQVPDMTMESGSTEQMVQYGKYVYCNCWSYQNRIIKIDTETDQVVDELKVGIQPTSLVMDKYNKCGR